MGGAWRRAVARLRTLMARTDPRPNYGLGRRVREDGYADIWAPTHPLARRDGYIAEHRMVAYDVGLQQDLIEQ